VVQRKAGASPRATPSSWLLANAHLLPHAGRALDVASGRGRHALWLAARGLRVRAIDRDGVALEALRSASRDLGLAVDAEVQDIEVGCPDLGSGYSVIVVVNYLHRPLFPALRAALAPGGLLLYETFLESHGERRPPSRPEHLLKAGELPLLVAPLEILTQREGEFDGRLVAGVVARVPAGP
jgi:SAM-dependent methyltransferase